jgi:hypothetical protein
MEAKNFRKYVTCIDAYMLNHLHTGNRTNSETQLMHVVSQATTGRATKHTDYNLKSLRKQRVDEQCHNYSILGHAYVCA